MQTLYAWAPECKCWGEDLVTAALFQRKLQAGREVLRPEPVARTKALPPHSLHPGDGCPLSNPLNFPLRDFL